MLGDSWVNLGRPHINSDDILCITSLGDGIVLIGTGCPVGNAGHWFKSTNWGLTWVDKGVMPSDTAEENVNVFVDCNGGVVVAGMAPGKGQISRSTNYGDSFTWIKELHLWHGKILSGAYLGNSIVIVGTGTSWITAPRIFRSLDKGLTWDAGQSVSNFPAGVRRLLNLGGGVALYGSSEGDIGRTTNYGANWTVSIYDFGGFTEGVEEMLNISGIVYAFLRNGEIWKSSDQGSNWTKMGETGTTGVRGFAYAPELNLMFVGVGGIGFTGRIYRSQNKGQTWSDLGIISAPGGGIRAIGYIHGTSEHIVLAGDGGEVLDDVAHIFRAAEAFKEARAPDNLLCEQTKNPTDVSDPKPEFSAIHRYE